MSTTLTGVEFRPLTIPASVDAADAADFNEMVRVRNIVYRETRGHDDEYMEPSELLPHYQPDEHERRYMWIVLVDDEVVGRVGVDVPLDEGSRAVYWSIELHPRVWGRGLGTAAHDLVVRMARDEGRATLQSWAERPEAPGQRLEAPTGYGSIPRDHVANFYLGLGYTLEQVERVSAFDLQAPSDHVEALLRDARRAAAGYRVVQWQPPVPDEYAAGYAWMKSRMSTDAPVANLEFAEETWDVERIRSYESRYIEGGQTVLVTAAQHIETGELCAFNELVIGEDLTIASHQEDTLVLKEHRGHRLGMLVKTAGLLKWRELVPDSPRVITYNAEENRPMLDINEAIGFVATAYEGAWKKALDD